MQCDRAGKLRLDLPRRSRLPDPMDRDTRELVAQLATRLGMAFEDAAPVALTLEAMDDGERALAVGSLERSLARTNALLDAIIVLIR